MQILGEREEKEKEKGKTSLHSWVLPSTGYSRSIQLDSIQLILSRTRLQLGGGLLVYYRHFSLPPWYELSKQTFRHFLYPDILRNRRLFRPVMCVVPPL